MRPLIWKELRENLRWALLLMLGMSVALVFVLWEGRYSYPGQRPVTASSIEFQGVAIFGGGIVALLLGFLQIIPELFRDRWSFLVHRPASRNQLFWGKVLAGVILYSVGAVLPVTIATFWTALPGRVAAPFTARMLLPLGCHLLAGFTYYFAAIVTALRQARVYATRGVPLVATVLTSSGVFVSPQAYHAILLIALSWAVFGIAAHGAFVGGGDYRPLRSVARFSTGLLLACGLFIIAALGGALVSGAIEEMSFRHYDYANYFADVNGRMLLVRGNSPQNDRVILTDLEGKPVTDFPDSQQYYHHSAEFRNVQDSGYYQPFFSMPERVCEYVWGAEQELWYFRSDCRLFQGFDARSRRVMGWLGKNGFVNDAGKAEPFAVRAGKTFFGWNNPHPLLSEDRAVYEVDLSSHSVKKLYETSATERIKGAIILPTKDKILESSKALRNAIAIATDQHIVVLNRSGKVLMTVPNRTQHPQVAIITRDRLLVWREGFNAYYRGGDPDDPVGAPYDTPKQSRVDMYDARGEKLESHPVPCINAPFREARTYVSVLMGGVPPAGYLSSLVIAAVCVAPDDDGTFMDFVRHLWKSIVWQAQHQRTGFVITISVGLGLIILAWILCDRIGRKYAFSVQETRAWRTLSVLLGFIAVPTMLSLREWPLLVACPACSKRRRTDRERCEHCGESFPAAEIRTGDIYDAESPQGSNEPPRVDASLPV